MEIIIQIFLGVLAIYVTVGLLFGIYFFVKGAFRIDPLIADSKWTVRLLLIPGAIALWPILLIKVFKKQKSKL